MALRHVKDSFSLAIEELSHTLPGLEERLHANKISQAVPLAIKTSTTLQHLRTQNIYTRFERYEDISKAADQTLISVNELIRHLLFRKPVEEFPIAKIRDLIEKSESLRKAIKTVG